MNHLWPQLCMNKQKSPSLPVLLGYSALAIRQSHEVISRHWLRSICAGGTLQKHLGTKMLLVVSDFTLPALLCLSSLLSLFGAPWTG